MISLTMMNHGSLVWIKLFSCLQLFVATVWMPIGFFMGFDCLFMAYDCEDRKVSAQDLRLKLQRKGLQPASQSGKSYAPKMRDLRERLSGTMTVQPTNSDPPKSKAVKPISKNVGVEGPAVQIKRPAEPAPKRSRKVIFLLYNIFNCQLELLFACSLYM